MASVLIGSTELKHYIEDKSFERQTKLAKQYLCGGEPFVHLYASSKAFWKGGYVNELTTGMMSSPGLKKLFVVLMNSTGVASHQSKTPRGLTKWKIK